MREVVVFEWNTLWCPLLYLRIEEGEVVGIVRRYEWLALFTLPASTK
jgi:hypothetical protein